MSDTTVSPVSGASYFGQTAASKKSQLDMSTFLNLLVTQLQNQNPLEPMDDSAFYTQISQLGQVQGLQKLNSSADLGQAQALLGKSVSAVRPVSSDSGKQGESFTGTVQSITFKNGAQYLNVKEDGSEGTVQIQLSAISQVLPTADVASNLGLIGKQVASSVTYKTEKGPQAVMGKIVGISNVDGVATAQIKSQTDGKLREVPISSLTQIASSDALG